MPDIGIDAFSKLTLSLAITGTRADGYHELDALMVSVTEPHDSMLIRLNDESLGVGCVVSGPYAAAVGPAHENLAVLAALAFRERFDVTDGVEVSLHKGIPAGAGLGGGSADAAAVLVALRALSGGAVGDDALLPIAASLGADVAFCLRGGAARVRGIGEVLEPVRVPALVVVSATPPFAGATPAAYRVWDELGGPRGVEVDVDGLGTVRNDLEPAALALEPRLVAFKSAVEAAAGRPAILAGSGSSYAIVFADAVEAEQARARIADAIEGSVWTGTTTDLGHAPNL